MKRNYKVIVLTLFIVLLYPSLPLGKRAIQVKGNRLALVIGNADYKYAGDLANAINDARDIKETLENLGFNVIKYENCTQKIMKRAIDVFGKRLKNYDVGLFFYAGHGVQVRGFNYLIPTDARLEYKSDTEYDCVRADRVLRKMESAASKTNIVILDACRENPFERSWQRGGRGKGLAFMNAPSGSLIAYATSPGETALDGLGGRNGVYTSALLEHIATPNINILQMFQRVRSTVMDKTKNEQIPWEATSLRGDYYFLPKEVFNVAKHSKEKLQPIKNDTDLANMLNRPQRERQKLERLKMGNQQERREENHKKFEGKKETTSTPIISYTPKIEILKGIEIGIVESINRDWEFIVISLYDSSSVTLGDKVIIYNKGSKHEMTIKRIHGNRASVIPPRKLSDISLGLKVYK